MYAERRVSRNTGDVHWCIVDDAGLVYPFGDDKTYVEAILRSREGVSGYFTDDRLGITLVPRFETGMYERVNFEDLLPCDGDWRTVTDFSVIQEADSIDIYEKQPSQGFVLRGRVRESLDGKWGEVPSSCAKCGHTSVPPWFFTFCPQCDGGSYYYRHRDGSRPVQQSIRDRLEQASMENTQARFTAVNSIGPASISFTSTGVFCPHERIIGGNLQLKTRKGHRVATLDLEAPEPTREELKMALLKGKKNIGKNIATEENAGKPPKQAIAIAESVAGNAKPKAKRKAKK